jgi:uncharacterized UPF0146 family protein
LRESCKGLVSYISARYKTAAEIGIGHFPDVALALTGKGLRVFATDTKPFSYRDLKVITDDIADPEIALYGGVRLLYSLRPPPELVPYMKKLAQRLPADLIVKPLASEHLERPLRRHQTTTFYLWKFL